MGNENIKKIKDLTINNSSKNKNMSNNNFSKNEFQNENKENNDFTKKKQKRFATVFQWDGDGKNVYLTGSFCDWHQFFEMEKCEDPENNKNNKFLLTLFLPKGEYQYKFKIDEQWKCNSNFPTCSDKNGNINNIIDLTKKLKEEVTTDFTTSYVTTGGGEQILDETNLLNLSRIFKNDNDNDNENDKELSQICSQINNIWNNSSLYNYNNDFNSIDLISNKKEIKENNKSLEEEELNRLFENCFYKKKISLRHEHIDHLSLKRNIFNKQNHKNLISSCSFRYGFKTTTIIYYKPITNGRQSNCGIT